MPSENMPMAITGIMIAPPFNPLRFYPTLAVALILLLSTTAAAQKPDLSTWSRRSSESRATRADESAPR